MAAYREVHRRLERERGAASEHTCTACKAVPATGWAYQHNDPDALIGDQGHPYSTDLTKYEPLCSSCHTRLDLFGSCCKVCVADCATWT